MRFDIDAEFADDGTTIELISLGVVAEDGRTLYMENDAFDWETAGFWLRENVQPWMSGGSDLHPIWEIAEALVAFVGPEPEFWGWYADYDWVVVCQLFGRMVDLPDGWPRFCRDTKQLHVDLGSPELPPHVGRDHHALDDALHQQAVRRFLERRRPAALFYNAQWLQLLGVSLVEEIWARFNIEDRFQGLSAVALAEGARPWLRTAGAVAVAHNRTIEVSTPADRGPGEFNMFVVPTEPFGFEADLDMDDMIGWAWGAARADVVESCVSLLTDMVWDTVAGLFARTLAASSRERAELGIRFQQGGDELIEFVLPSGIPVVVRPADLVLASAGPLAGVAVLAEDGERCILRCRLSLCAGLVLGGGRRLHVEAPGPVSTVVDQ